MGTRGTHVNNLLFVSLVIHLLLQRSQLRTQGFPDSSAVENPPTNAGDAGLILGLEDSLEEEMATHSSILAWRIPWTKEPGGLQSPRVRHISVTELS